MYIISRYIADIFFTSNATLDTIDRMLDEANQFHSNIKLLRQLGTSVSFLDVYIENKNGILATSVFHKEAAELDILPFNSDHP
jgi:response regulator of citrate/malate metabolism